MADQDTFTFYDAASLYDALSELPIEDEIKVYDMAGNLLTHFQLFDSKGKKRIVLK